MSSRSREPVALAFALFGLGIAGWAVLFGALTCEAGRVGTGPAWADDRDAAQWGFYRQLGLLFAFAAAASAWAAWQRRSIAAFATWGVAVLTSSALWWRVDIVSPNSAGDLWPWLTAGLLLGLIAALTTRPRVSALLVAAAPVAAAAGLIAWQLAATAPATVTDVLRAAGTDAPGPPSAFAAITIDLLQVPTAAVGELRPVGAKHFEIGSRSGVRVVFAHDETRLAYVLLAGTQGLSDADGRTEHIQVGRDRRTLTWIGPDVLTFEREGRSVIVTGTPGGGKTAAQMRQLAAFG
jgi:hypothetical protein